MMLPLLLPSPPVLHTPQTLVGSVGCTLRGAAAAPDCLTHTAAAAAWEAPVSSSKGRRCVCWVWGGGPGTTVGGCVAQGWSPACCNVRQQLVCAKAGGSASQLIQAKQASRAWDAAACIARTAAEALIVEESPRACVSVRGRGGRGCRCHRVGRHAWQCLLLLHSVPLLSRAVTLTCSAMVLKRRGGRPSAAACALHAAAARRTSCSLRGSRGWGQPAQAASQMLLVSLM